MNPFLEQPDVWAEFQNRFMTYAAETLESQVGESYLVNLKTLVVCGREPTPEDERQAHLEIRDRRNRRVVTVIEMLSPTNKRAGRDRDEYLMKRNAILTIGTAHLVETDLLRGGTCP